MQLSRLKNVFRRRIGARHTDISVVGGNSRPEPNIHLNSNKKPEVIQAGSPTQPPERKPSPHPLVPTRNSSHTDSTRTAFISRSGQRASRHFQPFEPKENSKVVAELQPLSSNTKPVDSESTSELNKSEGTVARPPPRHSTFPAFQFTATAFSTSNKNEETQAPSKAATIETEIDIIVPSIKGTQTNAKAVQTNSLVFRSNLPNQVPYKNKEYQTAPKPAKTENKIDILVPSTIGARTPAKATQKKKLVIPLNLIKPVPIATMAMLQANVLKKVLDEGTRPSLGVWQMLPGSNVSRTMARCGVDWVLVDCEHGNIDDAAMHEAVGAIAACGVSPIVRIADNQGWMVKRALDSGAHGVVVPLMNTAEDAKRLVSSAKFPPNGQRGFGSPFPMGAFHPSMAALDYLNQADESILTIVQIETADGLKNAKEIAAVPGIDMLFVGPFDLGNNIGYPVLDGKFHPRLQTAIETILKAAKDAGKKAGIFCTGGDHSAACAKLGFDMISVTTDMMALPSFIIDSLNTARGEQQGAKLTGPYGR